MIIDPMNAFNKYFPCLSDSFELKEFQINVISNILTIGSTTAIMPTGGGKSLIYWVSGKALGGITLVISPLIALIDEQSMKLEEQGIKTFVAHAGIDANHQIKQLTDLYNKEFNPDFIFASPERIATDGYFEFCLKKRAKDIKLLVIDEIHCVSQWGFDFRPFYKRIPFFINSVFGANWPPILGLTATINPKELKDISEEFKIPRSSIIKDSILLRFDIQLIVEKYTSENEKEERLWKLISKHSDQKILVYLYRKHHKRGTEELCTSAISKGFKSAFFHGDMSGQERQGVLQKFRNQEYNVIFATNAFGMGIDIPDIKVIIHYMIPESVEQYYQEIGRAGRDSKGAIAYILYSNKNIEIRKKHFIDKRYPDSDTLIRVWKKISNNKPGKKTLQYFQDEEIQESLPFFLNTNLINITAKGFTHLNVIKNVKDSVISNLLGLTKTSMITSVLEKAQLSEGQIFDMLYSALAKRQLEYRNNPDKCLLINCKYGEINEEILTAINNEIEIKRAYKHDLHDYLAYILDNYEDSTKLHQEIGRYLGVDRHSLNKIYRTEKGDWVRSKSEVIIANLLFKNNLEYEYEKKLYYTDTKWIEPDFTIMISNKNVYWEHLGLLGDDEYDQRWIEKKEIYDKIKESILITTKESSILSADVVDKISFIQSCK